MPGGGLALAMALLGLAPITALPVSAAPHSVVADSATRDTITARRFPASPAAPRIAPTEGGDAPIRDLARRWAREGYVAIVPDLYHGKAPPDSARANALESGLSPKSVLADLHAAARWLSAQPRFGGSRSAVLGVGTGGPFAQAFASDTSRVAAVILLGAGPDVDSTRVARLRVPIQAFLATRLGH